MPATDASTHASRIFISYRREDSELAASRLADDLCRYFTREQVFQDFASIDPGADFVEAVQRGLETKVVAAELPSGAGFRDAADLPEMVVIPAGRFLMGSPESEPERSNAEGPQHEVTIARPFAVGRYAVTFDEWDACVPAGGCQHRLGDERWGRGSRPVVNVSLDDAQAYVAWLTKRTGKPYRLLSEAEWEYAARAGSKTAYPWGEDPGTNRANFGLSGSQWSDKQTAPVGSFAPNVFGLYDMIGNVWEWTQDCWNDSYAGAPMDALPWLKGECGWRVVRGGSWGIAPAYTRAACRSGDGPGVRLNFQGFRLARTL